MNWREYTPPPTKFHDSPKAGADHVQPGRGGHRLDVLGDGNKLGSYSLDAVLCVKANGPAKNVSALARMVWVARTGGMKKKPDGWQTQASGRLFWDVDSPYWVGIRNNRTTFGDDAWIPPWAQEKLFYRYADGSIGLSDYGEAVAESLASSRDLALWEVE